MKKKDYKNKIYGDVMIPLYITIALLVVTVIISVNFYKIPLLCKIGIYNTNFWNSFLINVHNTLLDTLIFSVLVVCITRKSEKRRNIERYNENIDDNRFIFSDEASYRIAANIRRLNNNKIYEIDLTKCNLKNAILNDSKLNSSKLMGSNLENVNLKNSSLIDVDMKGANLHSANFNGANLSSAKLKNVKCNDTNFKGAILNNAILIKASLINSDFTNTDFRQADLKDVIYKDSIFSDANFKSARNIDINKLIESKSLKKAKLDDDIKSQIEIIKPELLRN